MIIVLKPRTSDENVKRVENMVRAKGLEVHTVKGEDLTIIGCIGDTVRVDPKLFEVDSSVEKVMHVQEPYKLVNRAFHPDDTIVDVSGVKVGGGHLALIAGPCSVESEEQVIAAREETGLPIVTELMSPEYLEIFDEKVDLIQIGARNMQNYDLLKQLGQTKRPILLKRGLNATYEEWMMSAEYIMASGNPNVILCERGIRTFETYTRNTLDLQSIPVVRKLSHLPVVVDPSHAGGKWWLVDPMAKASVAAGADGLIIEVHNSPEMALCDGAQSLKPEKYDTLLKEITGIAKAVGKEM